MKDKRYAVSLYGGQLTDGDWRESVKGKADFVHSQILVGAVAWTFLRADNDWWSLEMEANVARHFHRQDHWEFNLPIVSLRWHLFPWKDFLDTSLAFGLGPSYATEVPAFEVENNTDSEQFLLYWHLDLALGLPEKDWALMFRLHHRSAGYGLFADKGGSNALTAGFRYFF